MDVRLNSGNSHSLRALKTWDDMNLSRVFKNSCSSVNLSRQLYIQCMPLGYWLRSPENCMHCSHCWLQGKTATSYIRKTVSQTNTRHFTKLNMLLDRSLTFTLTSLNVPWQSKTYCSAVEKATIHPQASAAGRNCEFLEEAINESF